MVAKKYCGKDSDISTPDKEKILEMSVAFQRYFNVQPDFLKINTLLQDHEDLKENEKFSNFLVEIQDCFYHEEERGVVRDS
ncbi:hypothetical protein AB834_01980 [PVC group bacterium (ex Bugula neritina AB1)]|nr:hypothetical protein AB834_01980 [PVC group bacterium (ex Bugula neritina AB1)]